jgi:predicted phosphate transport protein (TIGR00153 family)
MFVTSPFDGLQEHAAKVKECAWAFQQAMECHLSQRCEEFESFRKDVERLENEADAIKRRIRGHLPLGTMMPVAKFQLFRYLREQDKVLDGVRDTLNWLSFRNEPGIPDTLEKDLTLLVDATIDAIEMMDQMVAAAKEYFATYNSRKRDAVKEIIRTIRQQEHDVDVIEKELMAKIFNLETDAVSIFHMVRMTETIGSIADHAENAGDMMRAMLAR